MHAIDYTLNQLHQRPGSCGTDDMRPSVSERLKSSVIANEQFDVYESDLGMT